MSNEYAETTSLKDVLNEALEEYQSGKSEHINVLIIGPTGCGKTAIVKEWLEENSDKVDQRWFLANCYPHETTKWKMASGKDIQLEKGHYFVHGELDHMNRENCVTVIDHFDFPRPDARPHLMNLVRNREAVVIDYDADNDQPIYGEMELDKLGILIAIAWNRSHLESTPLSDEEINAFDYVVRM